MGQLGRGLLACLLVPGIAYADEPAPPDPGPPPGPIAGAPPGPPPGPVYAPPAGPPPPGPGYAPPGGGYAQQPPPPLATARRGVTFEANLGLGYVHASASSGGQSNSDNSDAALAGVNLGIGGWLSPQLALTARIAGVDVKSGNMSSSDGTIVNAYFGPSLQYWPDPHFWFGGGVGFATFRQVGGTCASTSQDGCGFNGWGLDLRAGYTFGISQHTFNVSVELNPAFYSPQGISLTATGIAFLAGYQYL